MEQLKRSRPEISRAFGELDLMGDRHGVGLLVDRIPDGKQRLFKPTEALLRIRDELVRRIHKKPSVTASQESMSE